MADTWMYDGFPLKRADENTRGDQYPYVIQSLDAAIRHALGFPTGVSLTPAFSITVDGDVEILQSLSLGSDIAIDEIVDEIAEVASSVDDGQLANVTAIRAFTSDFIDTYLQAQGLFVEKAGDTMTGALIANGGITAAVDLDITKALFKDNPRLDTGIALESENAELIQYDSGVRVGDVTKSLRLTGAAGRPEYKGESVALLSDIAGTIPGLDYVPAAGGQFDGLVTHDASIRFTAGNGIDFEWDTGGSFFTLAVVGDDALGNVVFDSGSGDFEFEGSVEAETFDLDIEGSVENVLAYTSSEVQVGHASVDINLLGLASRPLYNGFDIALTSDIAGTFVEGSGITFEDLGGGVSEINITTNGITSAHLPIGNNGEYPRLSPGGVTIWGSLDVIAGAGMVVNEDGGTKQLTVSIDDLGVDTAQLADDAVTLAKLADDAVDFTNINATRGLDVDVQYSLTQTNDTLEWVKGAAGGVLGSTELIEEDSGSTASDTYIEFMNVTDGPYILEKVHGGGTTAQQYHQAWFQIWVDGVLVIEDYAYGYSSRGDVLLGDGGYYAFPLFAKESLVIKVKSFYDASYFVTGYAVALRMT